MSRRGFLRYCDSEFRPHIEKVLKRLPAKVRKMVTGPGWEIVSLEDEFGRCYHLDPPAEHLIMLKESLLSMPEYHIVHTIAHEIAHGVAGEGRSGLPEKEAEELMQRWGFEEESRKVDYIRPSLQSDGYKVGYEWACKQEKGKLLEDYEEFLEEWDSGWIDLPEPISVSVSGFAGELSKIGFGVMERVKEVYRLKKPKGQATRKKTARKKS